MGDMCSAQASQRVALLVGVSEYGEGYPPLPGTATDLERMRSVLENPEMGGFEVETLTNPYAQTLREKMERFFGDRSKEDVLLFYFSGHGALDPYVGNQLYLSTRETRKVNKQLVESSAVESARLHHYLVNSKSQQKVVILDCCFSGAVANFLQKGEDTTNLQQLKARGTVLLASCSAFNESYQTKCGVGAGVAQSLYTQYLVEGIETGAARQGQREWILAQDLHEYARKRFQTERAAAMEPQIIVLKQEGYGIPVARAPKEDPKVAYRQIVVEVLEEDDGEVDELDRIHLGLVQDELQLSEEEAQQILNEQQKPYVIRREKRAIYRRAFEAALHPGGSLSALSERTRRKLARIQTQLGLRNEDISKIEADLLREIEADLLLSESPFTIAEFYTPQTVSDEEGVDNTVTQIPSTLDAVPPRYEKLAELLAAAERDDEADKWKAADQETLHVMCEVAGRESEGWLRATDVQDFPCEDLKAIDRLWAKHSDGKFGFSVQKQIWQDCGSPDDYSEDWKRFGNEVGWRKDQNWIKYSDVAFDTKALTRTSPGRLRLEGVFLAPCCCCVALLSRVQICGV
ncbi:MAG: GUN4 domain-containing protein [Cyanobacteria bacterium P01_A01_bin.135]